MTNLLLEEALKVFIENNTKDFLLPIPKSELFKQPKVITGFLAPETKEEDEIPVIVIRTLKSQDTATEREIEIKIVIAIFNKSTKEGYQNLVRLTQKIVDSLTQNPILGDYFYLNENINWTIEEEMPYPFWISELRISFKGQKPEFIVL